MLKFAPLSENKEIILTTISDFILEKLDDLKATDIQRLDVKGKSSVCDEMILCTGTSSRHVASVAEKLITLCKQAGIETFGDEGKAVADWIVVDFGQVLVHIMQAESRELYQLEKLWC